MLVAQSGAETLMLDSTPQTLPPNHLLIPLLSLRDIANCYLSGRSHKEYPKLDSRPSFLNKA